MAPTRKDIKDTPGWPIYCALLKYADELDEIAVNPV